jgi:hypothetical protein
VVRAGEQVHGLHRSAVQTHVLGQRAQAQAVAARHVLSVAILLLELQIGVQAAQANIALRTLDLDRK